VLLSRRRLCPVPQAPVAVKLRVSASLAELSIRRPCSPAASRRRSCHPSTRRALFHKVKDCCRLLEAALETGYAEFSVRTKRVAVVLSASVVLRDQLFRSCITFVSPGSPRSGAHPPVRFKPPNPQRLGPHLHQRASFKMSDLIERFLSILVILVAFACGYAVRDWMIAPTLRCRARKFLQKTSGRLAVCQSRSAASCKRLQLPALASASCVCGLDCVLGL
jgi:hypothetical protein